MNRLLASRLLKKGTQTAEDEPEWRAKKRWQSPERSCLPTAATLPSAMNGDFGTSRLEEGDPQTSRQLISHRRAWQRVRIFSNAAAPLLRSTMFLVGPLDSQLRLDHAPQLADEMGHLRRFERTPVTSAGTPKPTFACTATSDGVGPDGDV